LPFPLYTNVKNFTKPFTSSGNGLIIIMENSKIKPIISKGLYTPQLESDACGTGLIANLKGNKSHQLIDQALQMLENMEHRGACGCEPNTGDGAGILIQIPHLFFQAKAKELGFFLPDMGLYGVGMIFFPTDRVLREQCRVLLNDYIDE
jgi:glutamate synthase (NADPH/NADH) large chain